MIFTIYTDGSCPKPQGPGGWASVCLEDEGRTAIGYELETTNNRMEMSAVIRGLDALPAGSVVTVYSDSQYVVFGVNDWVDGWEKAGWPRRIKNRDLWLELLRAVSGHRSVAFAHVKGHNGNTWNEMADELAGYETEKAREILRQEAA